MSPYAVLWRRSRQALQFGFYLALTGAVGILMFLSSRHYSRIALESYVEVDGIQALYAPPLLNERKASSIEDVLAVLEPNNQIPRNAELGIQTCDAPDSCVSSFAKGQIMDCYNLSIAGITMLKDKGIEARLWNLTGTDGFGGNGHNVMEYYNAETQRWEMIDLNYSFYFVRKGQPQHVLSVAEMRELALTNPTALEVKYFKSAVPLRPALDLVEEFRILAPTASLHANTDFRTRHEIRYAGLMPLSSLIDLLPLAARRGVRSVLLGSSDAKLLVADRFTPGYHLTLYTILWYLAVSLVALGSMLLLLPPIGLVLHPVLDYMRRTRYA